MHHKVISGIEYFFLLVRHRACNAGSDCVTKDVCIVGSTLIEGTHFKCVIRMAQVASLMSALTVHLDVSWLATTETPCLLVALNSLVSVQNTEIGIPLHV